MSNPNQVHSSQQQVDGQQPHTGNLDTTYGPAEKLHPKHYNQLRRDIAVTLGAAVVTTVFVGPITYICSKYSKQSPEVKHAASETTKKPLTVTEQDRDLANRAIQNRLNLLNQRAIAYNKQENPDSDSATSADTEIKKVIKNGPYMSETLRYTSTSAGAGEQAPVTSIDLSAEIEMKKSDGTIEGQLTTRTVVESNESAYGINGWTIKGYKGHIMTLYYDTANSHKNNTAELDNILENLDNQFNAITSPITQPMD